MKLFFEILGFLIKLFISIGLLLLWINIEFISQWNIKFKKRNVKNEKNEKNQKHN